MTGHYSTIYTLAFHPHGKMLATAGDDAKIIIWDLGSGKKIKTLSGHTKPIWSLDFSQDGSVLASGSADNTVRIWQIAGVRCIVVVSSSQCLEAVALTVVSGPDGRELQEQEDILVFHIDLFECTALQGAPRNAADQADTRSQDTLHTSQLAARCWHLRSADTIHVTTRSTLLHG